MDIRDYANGCNDICKCFTEENVNRCNDGCPLRDLDCGNMINEDDTVMAPMSIERMERVEAVILDFKTRTNGIRGNAFIKISSCEPPRFPQDEETNEYRYLYPQWINAISCGLTEGNRKHPGATWKSIPAAEHAARAMRHINMFLMGDRSENHLINASMRMMMAYAVEENEEKLQGRNIGAQQTIQANICQGNGR